MRLIVGMASACWVVTGLATWAMVMGNLVALYVVLGAGICAVVLTVLALALFDGN